MGISEVISLLGGVALFLFGMSLMGDGLKKVAGNKLETILYKLSDTPIKGLLLGTGVTAVIQSSSATSVMVVGFVNSGIMTLEQSISILHGALVGTSITGWIVCLSSIEGTGWVSLLSTHTIAAVVAVAGVVLRMFPRRASDKHVGDIMLGFAVLMYGMQAMTGAVAPLKQSPAFINMLTTFTNPFIGIIVGFIFTAILQSASAAVGILQALSMTGAVSFATAFPLIMGIAVGASVPVMLSSIGAKTDGRRTAVLYPVIEVIAVVLFAVAYYVPSLFIQYPFATMIVSPVSIAIFNTLFRVASAVVLMPFNKPILKLVHRMVKESKDEQAANEIFSKLDERFLVNPAVAIDQSGMTIRDMARLAVKNITDAIELVGNYSEAGMKRVISDEDITDKYEDKLGNYLMKINTQELSRDLNEEVSKYLSTLSDFERISDHALNIAETAKEITEKNVVFSEDAQNELKVLFAAVREILDLSVNGFIENNVDKAYMVEPLEEQIDVLTDTMKSRHIDRVQSGNCSLQQGFVFNDILTNCERAADHCSNIAIAVIEEKEGKHDAHGYVTNLKELHQHSFDKYFDMFGEKYSI